MDKQSIKIYVILLLLVIFNVNIFAQIKVDSAEVKLRMDLDKAEFYYKRGNTDKVIEILATHTHNKIVLKKQPKELLVQAYRLKAQSHILQKEEKKAIVEIKELMSVAPTYLQVYKREDDLTRLHTYIDTLLPYLRPNSKIGFKTGINFSSARIIDYNSIFSPNEKREYKLYPGLSLGLSLQKRFSRHTSIALEPIYNKSILKISHTYHSGNLATELKENSKISMNTIQFPLFFQIDFQNSRRKIEKNFFLIKFGGFISYLQYCEVIYVNSFVDITQLTNRITGGYTASIEWLFTRPSYQFGIELNYMGNSRSLVSQDDVFYNNMKNNKLLYSHYYALDNLKMRNYKLMFVYLYNLSYKVFYD